jgi:hypothetical protein
LIAPDIAPTGDNLTPLPGAGHTEMIKNILENIAVIITS